jgi:hypothetical protein
MKRILGNILVSFLTAAAVVTLAVGPMPRVLAQSTRRGGLDVPVTPFEQWFKRLGLLNTASGCDVALEYDSLNTARFTDCTDTANLRDVKARGLILSGGVPTSLGGANTDAYLSKTVTAMTDAAATNVLLFTVPNTANAAVIPVVIMSSLGAGGAIGAFECTGTAYGQIVVTRTPGVATVATAVALSNAGSACVAGATTITTAYAVTAMTGAVGATQTFNMTVTITKGGGSSASHQVFIQADLLNAQAAGITVS